MKPIFKIDHGNYQTAFLFNAFYSALIFAVLFVINDMVDDYILDKTKKQYGYKLFIHGIITFIFTYLLVLGMWYVFGWGKTLFG
jgi:hypothetical protein